MKKIILLTLITFMMMGCTKKDSKGHIAINTDNLSNPYTSIIDSCEYICWGYGLAHKGNCRFCKERRQKELKELVEQLKNR